jgi:hypothetical protein
MADSNSLTTRVYRDGKLVDLADEAYVRSQKSAKSVLVENCWEWLSRREMQRIMLQAYLTAQKSCLPDDGRPFFEDGMCYARPEDFLESLIEEVRALLLFHFGTPLRGDNFGMLTDLKAARVACGRSAKVDL